MKTISISMLFLLMIIGTSISAQKSSSSEKYGGTLNLGLGVGGYSGYYGYVGRSLPVLHINYEFDVLNDFTLAPFATFYTYRSDHYRETVIPIGVKGSYYLDKAFNANSNWDFYLAGSLGAALGTTSWDRDYNGDRDYYRGRGDLFLDAHFGVEYHINSKLGLFLDLSTGVSTIGLAFH